MGKALWSVWFIFSISLSGSAQDVGAGGVVHKEITLREVYDSISRFRGEIELIRLEMGKPEVGESPIRVEKAVPREVYFQALTLYQKASRLVFEHTGAIGNEPLMPSGPINQGHVNELIKQALQFVSSVKDSLRIAEPPALPPGDAEITPTRVYNLILSANRELNNLLDQKFTPGDVFQQVSLAVAYAARLLDSPKTVSTPPEAPPFESRKRPADVYRKLIGCFQQIDEIGKLSGAEMLGLKLNDSSVERAEPSDVYDVASLLISELAYLHSLRSGASPPRKVYDAGRKLPSHVYQRIGILTNQLDSLRQFVTSNPDWLNR